MNPIIEQAPSTDFFATILDSNCADAQFLQGLTFARSASPELTRAASQGDLAGFAGTWERIFREKQTSGRARELADSLLEHLAGCAHSFAPAACTPHTQQLLDYVKRARIRSHAPTNGRVGAKSGALAKGRAVARLNVRSGGAELPSALGEWLAALPAIPAPLDLILILDALPQLGDALAPAHFWTIWRRLLNLAARMLGPNPSASQIPATPYIEFLRLGELPWTMGVVFGDLAGAERLRASGSAYLVEQLLTQTDESGLPRAELFPVLPQWIASLLRATELAGRAGVVLWTAAASKRLALVVERIAQLVQPDGSLPFCEQEINGLPEALEIAPRLLVALREKPAPKKELNGSRRGSASTNGHATNGKPRGTADDDLADMPELGSPSFESDASRVACLRCDWMPDTDRITVEWHGRLPVIDMWTSGRRMFQGTWDIAINADGRDIPVSGEWECVCWNSDSDADYLELQCVVEGSLRIERQILLARGEGFALFADTVVVTGANTVAYSSRLPLAGGVALQMEPGAREGRLRGPKPIGRVFPIALPCNTVVSTPGGCGPRDGAIELKQVGAGSGLYAPLVIDWDPGRRNAPADWRTLTITEDRGVLRPDQAAAHRLRLGKQQWMIYHSLHNSPEARAVLGHNTRFETVIGTFDGDGEVGPILLIE